MDRNVSFPLTTGRRTLGFRDEKALREAVFGSKDFVQRMKLDRTLDVHRGCVNTINWNEQGSIILSGSDDKKLCLTNPYSRELLASIPTGHRSNIFSAKFLPSTRDRQVISCSGDGCIIYSDVEDRERFGQNVFNCHYGTAYEVVTLPSDPNTFMSCGEDGTVRWFDLRRKTSCSKEDCKEDVMINCRRAVTGVCVNPVLPYQLAVGCSDSSVRIFDRRMLGTKLSGNHVGRGIQGILCRFCPSHLQNKYSRPTSLTYSANGQDLLVSYASDFIYLFGTNARYKQESGEMLCGGADDGLVEEDPVTEEGAPGHPVKRLRLRGDWSDTGPRARPRSEIPEEQRPRPTMIQRMSEMLSRWLEDSASRPPRPGERSQADSTSPLSSQGGSSGTAPGSSASSRLGQRSVSEEMEATASVDVRSRIRALDRTVSDSGAGTSQSGSERKKAETASSSKDTGAESSQTGRKDDSAIAVKELEKETKNRKESDSHLQMDRKKSDTGAGSAEDSTGAESSQKLDTEALDTEATRRDEGSVDQSKKGSKDGNEGEEKNEGEKKGIFALGDRMEDRNPQARLTKQDSQEHVRTRKTSIVGAPPTESDVTNSCSQSQAAAVIDGQKDEEQSQSGDSGSSRGRESDDGGRKGQAGKKDEKEKGKKGEVQSEGASADSHRDVTGGEGTQATGGSPVGASALSEQSDSTQSSSERPRSGSSRSMTCSESESDEEMQILGIQREKKSPQPQEPPTQTRERVRSAAEMRLRELFKTKKQERDTEAEMIKNVFSPSVEMLYRGHRNSRTMIKEANFWGDHYIMSGSDCGHIFFWDRHTAELVMLLEGDKHVVNCIQPHPFDPLLASSGIDYNIKLWSPIAEDRGLPECAAEVVRINELMLEETRDTITVPPSFMLRMLASINHLRGDRRRFQDPHSPSESSDD